MYKYHAVCNILLNGIKLQSIQTGGESQLFTERVQDWNSYKSGFVVCDASKFGVNARKLYYVKKFKRVSVESELEALSETSEIGDICFVQNISRSDGGSSTTYSAYEVYYGDNKWVEIKARVVLTNRLKEYLAYGGPIDDGADDVTGETSPSNIIELAESVIGVISIPTYIKGSRVPNFLYYTQIES